MDVFFWLLIIFLLLLLVVDLLINKTFLTPGFIFNFLFFISLFLYSFQLSEIQTTFDGRTILCLWATILSFNIVVFAYYLIYRTKKKQLIGFYSVKDDNYKLSKNTIFVLRWLIILLFALQVIYSRGLPVIWKITGDGRSYFDFGIPSLTGAFYGLVILFGAYSLFKRGPDKFICLAIGLLIISRQLLISIVIEGVIFALLTSKHKIKYLPLKLIVGLIVLIVGFSLIGNFRTGNDEFLRVARFKEGTEWIPTGIKWVYSYLTFSFSNFNNLVTMTNGGMNHGASMFNGLLPTVFTDAFAIKEKETFNYLISINFNVSTFYPELYLDFGVFGIIWFSLALGFIFSAAHHYVYTRRGSRNCIVYAIIIHNVLFLTFVNMFIYLPVSIQFVYILLFFRKKAVSRSVETEESKKTNVINEYDLSIVK